MLAGLVNGTILAALSTIRGGKGSSYMESSIAGAAAGATLGLVTAPRRTLPYAIVLGTVCPVAKVYIDNFEKARRIDEKRKLRGTEVLRSIYPEKF